MKIPKIASIVGARPQFIKALPVSKELRKSCHEVIIHTGQHYDENMSEIFFEELGIPEPDFNLGVGSGKHGWQTGQMLTRIEETLLKEKPDFVLVYGDTNSTLAGALTAAKLGIPLGHVEAGLRSYDRSMPEEINRIVADHIADLLFCPTQTAVQNLNKEGIKEGVELVGDVMYDSAIYFGKIAEEYSSILERLNLEPGEYYLATIHRAGNTDIIENLSALLEAFSQCPKKVIFPVHPRTQRVIKKHNLLKLIDSAVLKLIEPVGYLDFLKLEKNAAKILTDSGGVQKEAYFFEVPCLTLREETEWLETLQDGWNTLVGTDKKKILTAINQPRPSTKPKAVFGDGQAAKRIATIILSYLEKERVYLPANS
jgi:UDP-N-acetylglucosamine 2-epimerase